MSKHHMIATLNHQFFVDIDNQLISEHFCAFLGIKATEIPWLLNPVPVKQVCKSIFAPREMYYFTMSQVYELIVKAPNRQFSDQLIKIISETILPLFNRNQILPIKHDDLKENDIMTNISTTIKTMSSLEIAELTGKRHDHVMRDICNMIEQLEKAKKDSPNLGCPPKLANANLRWYCESSTYTNKQNKSQPCYLLDYNTTVNLLTGYDAAKRMMVIQRWQELENKATSALPNFADPAEAAIAWANQYKEKERIQLELKSKEQILEQAKPMIGFAETVQKADKGILVRDLAYLAQNEENIKIGEKRLWNWLRTMGFVHQRSTRPIQEYVERGYFVMQPTMVHHHSGTQEHMTTKITGKGQIYFLNKLKEFFNNNGGNACPSM